MSFNMFFNLGTFNIFLLTCIIVSSCAQEKGFSRPAKKGSSRGQNLNRVQLRADADLQELVKKFMDKALKVVINNDPFQIKHLDLNNNGYGLKSEGYINNLILSFMSTTNLTNLNVENRDDSLHFDFDLSMNQFQIIGNYKLKFDIFTMLSIYGEGGLGLLLKDLRMKFKTKIKETNEQILQFTDMTIESYLRESKVETENLFNSPNLGKYISKILTDVLPITVNDNQKLFALLNIGLKALLNQQMISNAVTLDKVIDVMQHFIE